MGKTWGIVVTLAAAALLQAPTAHADPPPPGCQRDRMLGLSPQIREICDTDIQPDGSWTRFRSFSHPGYTRSTCGQYEYHTSAGFFCPPGAPMDTNPATETPVDQYVVTPDTIPAGEPGHIG